MTQTSAGFTTARDVFARAVEAGTYPDGVMMIVRSQGPVITHVTSPEIMPESLFVLASIAKAIWATAVMQLVEQGRLVLTTPVAKYIPEFAQHGKGHVTVWHLLTHTSGLIEPPDRVGVLMARRAPGPDWVDLTCDTTLAFEPGTKSQYGGFGNIVVSELIARVSGEPHQTYLRREVFEPLGMHDTTFVPTDPARIAPLQGASLDDLLYLTSLGASVWSTPSDVLRLGRAFLAGGTLGGHRLLSPAALATMTRLHTRGLFSEENGQRRSAYTALGWGKRSEEGGIIGSAASFGHTGAEGCILWIDPEFDLVFVLLSGCWNTTDNVLIPTLNAVYGEL